MSSGIWDKLFGHSSQLESMLGCWRSAGDFPLQSVVPFTNFINPEKKVQPKTLLSKYFVNLNSY